MCKSQFTASDKHDIIINFLYFLMKKRKLKHICIWKSYLRFITAYKSRMDGKDRYKNVDRVVTFQIYHCKKFV